MTKRKSKKTAPDPKDTHLSGIKEAFGADKVEVISNDELKARLGALLSGEEEPSNKFVAYLVEQLRAGNQEFRVVEQKIQELNGELSRLQKRAIQLQGEQAKYAKDIMAWMDTDNEPKESKDAD